MTSLFSFVFSNYQSHQVWPIKSESDQFGVQTAGVYNYYFYEIFSFQIPNKIKKPNLRPLEDYEYLNKNKHSYQNIFGENHSNVLLESDASSATINPKIANPNQTINGILKDKNIILVQLETFNHFLLDESGPYLDETFMPYLKELLSKSFYLSNFYTNVGIGHSSDAEFASQTGLLPEGSITLFWDFETNEYTFISLAEALNNYYSASLHADDKTFYNRINIYDKLFSFDELYYYFDDATDKNPYNVINAFPNSLDKTNPNSPWLSEKSLFEWTKSLAIQSLNKDENFYLFPITVHPHTPFKYDPYEDEPIFTSANLPNVDSTTLKMLNFGRFYDDIIRYLVELTNSLSDTVLIAYADHGTGFSLNDVKTLLGDFSLSDLEIWNEINKTFAFIYYPDPDEPNNPNNPYQIKESLIKGKQPLVRSQIDIYRTILELTAANQEIFYYGTNLLSDEHTFSYHAKTNMVTTDNMIISLKKYLSLDRQINQQSVYFFDNYLSKTELDNYVDYFVRFRLLTSEMILNNQAYQLSKNK
ncbi:MAG: sulfatase-like hydrolase/transferase [Acholeplasmataceae bacterium]|nr:sulfatase-like hydrolase/transferase [Acholeplasmataceae bacterium]